MEVCIMKKESRRTKNSYSREFKEKAVELAREIGTSNAAEKLGITNVQTLGAWVRYSKKIDEDSEFRDLEEAKKQIKKLQKELQEERKVTAILKDATAFFCQDRLK